MVLSSDAVTGVRELFRCMLDLHSNQLQASASRLEKVELNFEVPLRATVQLPSFLSFRTFAACLPC